MFVLQHRAIEPNSPRPIDYNWPLSIVSEIGLQFCPWCGVRLKNWYRKVITELDRSDLAVRSFATGFVLDLQACVRCGGINAKIAAVKPSIRLLAVDIDGTLLNSNFQISNANLNALNAAHRAGVEVVLVTGRRHTFALPVAQELGFDL